MTSEHPGPYASSRVRPAAPDDLPALRRILKESRQAAFTWLDPMTFQLEDYDRAPDGEVVLVAEVEGVVAAFIAWWPQDNLVHSLYVDPGHTRRGIGKQLLAECLQRIDRPARLKCQVQNDVALAFYRAQGWTIFERGVAQDGEFFLMELA